MSLSGLSAFAAPRRDPVAQLFQPDARFSVGRLSLTRPATNRFEIEVNIPEPPDVLAAALQDTGVAFTLSDKGKYAQALLGRAAGLEELLRQPGALETITELTRKRTERFKADLEKILQDESINGGIIDAALALARKRLPLPRRPVAGLLRSDLSADQVAGILEQFVTLGLCSRGFSILCATCYMERYIELSEVTAAGHVSGLRSRRRLPR